MLHAALASPPLATHAVYFDSFSLRNFGSALHFHSLLILQLHSLRPTPMKRKMPIYTTARLLAVTVIISDADYSI
jgi:hypothetical protein